uniref:Uncharacterized protein n=1 Tax=Romanomermis culicivorax TaxID=13658 RepID=A0A915IEY6_ROMCU
MRKYYPPMVLNIPADDNPEQISELRCSTEFLGMQIMPTFFLYYFSPTAGYFPDIQNMFVGLREALFV